jgi:predicted  nucleic acid-binding Zn-ribbon protein
MNILTKSVETMKAIKQQARYRYIEQEIMDAQEECAALGARIGRLITEREELRHELERVEL